MLVFVSVENIIVKRFIGVPHIVFDCAELLIN